MMRDMSKQTLKKPINNVGFGVPLAPTERLEILRRTAGSLAPRRAKQVLAYLKKSRKEADRKLAWPKHWRKT